MSAARPPSDAAPAAGIDWRWRRFDRLGLRELQHIYAARQQVFVVEQQCVFLDVDGCDEQAYHLAAWSAVQAQPLAYARILDPGVKYAEPSIGRVVTTAAARGSGLGRELMRRAIEGAHATWPGAGVRISAQQRLASFYRGFGFEPVGAAYIEDGIPHLEMLRPGRP